MGDVLPLKRQAVVERLKRRFELYRRHQNACLPRYEQAANGLYEGQKQETLVLKQRFLESKAKKSKTNKSDHHRNYKESATDSQKSQLHVKALKRPAEEPSTNAGPDCANAEDANKPAKILRTDTSTDKASAPDLQAQQSSLSTYSVQIVQQFTKTAHSQQPQTIQTNVTVQTLPKPLNSPLSQAPQTIATNQQESGANADRSQTTPVVNNVECKQEKDCVPPDLCQFKSNQSSNGDSGGGDRLADTFPSLGFADDSGDDVIHPELLKHIIEDVMTSEDLMKEFNFEDSVGSIKDQEDAAKDIIDLVKVSSPGQSRSFPTDGLSFGNSQANQNPQNGLFRSISANNETSMTVMSTTTTTPSTTASPFFSTPSQGLPSYGNSALSLPARLSLDFKLSEPSPAALTLKQMAEQHQNMQKQQQQQQLVNSPLTNRPSPFSQDSFTSHLNPLRSAGYLNGSNSAITSNSPKTPNAGTNIFGPFDRQISNFPGTEDLNSFPGCEPLTANLFESDIRSRNSVVLSDADRAKQQRLQVDPTCHQMEQQKPPAYGATRPLTHYSENAHLRPQNPLGGQHQRPMARQFQNNLQMAQSQHMHAGLAQHNAQRLQQNSHDPKQQQHSLMQPHPNMYGNYAAQQPASTTFHVALTQSVSYSSQFASNQSINRPPPEYKPQHHNITTDNLHLVEQLNSPSHMMFTQPSKNKYLNKNQRPPNVTITPDGTAIAPGSSDWRHNMMNQQPQNQFRMGSFPHQETYGDLMRNERLGVTAAPAPSPMYNQYRMPGNQMNTSRVVRPNMVPPNHILLQQRLRVPAPQGPRNPSMGEMDQHPSMSLNNNALSPASVMGPVFTNQPDMNRQDGSQINLDFLDHIESSASDLLNFDNVMQGGGASFPLLDDM